MRGLITTLPAFLLATLISAAQAAPPPVSTQPGASLLLPYFEVEMQPKISPGKAMKRSTVFHVHNADAAAALAHVTLWSDLSVPVFSFVVFLTGFDMQRIDIGDILNGELPVPSGDPSCNPGVVDGSLPTELVEHIRASLTGQPSPTNGQCAGLAHDDKKPTARGYVTIDNVNQCSTNHPGVPGYFVAGGNGIASNDNVLYGDFYYLEKKKPQSGGMLVPVRADADDPETSDNGQYTFYGAQVGYTAADNRQHLPQTFAARYVNDPKSKILRNTSLIVWRDSKIKQDYFSCGNLPNPFPLGQNQIVVFDDQENPEVLEPEALPPFIAEAQRVEVGSDALPVAFDRGWIFLDLGTVVSGGSPPPEDAVLTQAWVVVQHQSKPGKDAISHPAANLD